MKTYKIDKNQNTKSGNEYYNTNFTSGWGARMKERYIIKKIYWEDKDTICALAERVTENV